MDGRGGKYRRDASRRILPIFSLFLSDGTREEEEGGEERELPRGPGLRTKTPRIGSDYKMLNGIVVDLVTHLNFIRAGNWLRSKRSWKNRLGQRKVAITPCLLL